MTQEAQRLIGNFLAGQYVERWPVSEAHVILGGCELSYSDRISVGTFLFGWPKKTQGHCRSLKRRANVHVHGWCGCRSQRM